MNRATRLSKWHWPLHSALPGRDDVVVVSMYSSATKEEHVNVGPCGHATKAQKLHTAIRRRAVSGVLLYRWGVRESITHHNSLVYLTGPARASRRPRENASHALSLPRHYANGSREQRTHSLLCARLLTSTHCPGYAPLACMAEDITAEDCELRSLSSYERDTS